MARDKFVTKANLYDLAFDQFSRQYQAKRLIELVRTKKKLKILDVGGNNGKTSEFFPQDEVMIVDLYDIEGEGYTKASALDLPFSDGHYDVVTCFDVFEHIEPKDRKQFLSEISRVAKSYILVAAPFNTPYVNEAEVALNAYYKKINGSDHQWLKEHIDNTLPEQAEIEDFFTEAKLPFQNYASNNIMLWTAMQNLIFLADSVKAPERMSELNRFYNTHLLDLGDGSEPSYRRIYFAAKDAKLPEYHEFAHEPNPSTVRNWIDKSGIAVHELIYGNSMLKNQAETIADQERTIAKLNDRLETITGSRSYRLFETFQKAKQRTKQDKK